MFGLGEVGEQIPSAALIEQTARAAEGVADELTRADGREVRLHEDTTLPVQLLLPDDGFSCDVVRYFNNSRRKEKTNFK